MILDHDRPGVNLRVQILNSVSFITLGVLGGNKRLDEGIGALGVQREGVTQRGQLGTFLDERLLQPISTCVEVLLGSKQANNVKGSITAQRNRHASVLVFTHLDRLQPRVHNYALFGCQSLGFTASLPKTTVHRGWL